MRRNTPRAVAIAARKQELQAKILLGSGMLASLALLLLLISPW